MATLASDWLRHFRLLLWNRWTEFDETWQEARSQCPLPSLCFSGWSAKQDGRPGLCLAETSSTSPLKPLNGIWKKLDRKKDLNVLYEVCVFWANQKNKVAALASDWLRHFRFFSETAKISTSSSKFVFFRQIGKTRWPPWPSRQKDCTLNSGAWYVALWASCLCFSSFIDVLFFNCVKKIVEISPNFTEVILLLFKWTRFMRDL